MKQEASGPPDSQFCTHPLGPGHQRQISEPLHQGSFLLAADQALIQAATKETMVGIVIIKGNNASDELEDIRIIFMGLTVLLDLDNVAFAAAMLIGLIIKRPSPKVHRGSCLRGDSRVKTYEEIRFHFMNRHCGE
ncbi:hypothetical protein SKAU_G00014550 [Synaphobranchus kaupii]|uniref:Uncharacterized protein n=1 Tax=Synaphobranchus kaupii TaxID=118154 RepID=A0A9Q1GAY8_SYNKA|nr:hypothetical protein SKAU_G00014550 [Synaphobranchus kaupii]